MRSMGFRSRREFLQASAAIAAAGVLGDHRAASAAEQDLTVRSADPLNAEPPLAALVTSEITPLKNFYVRNHGPIPKVEVKDYKLRIEGMVRRAVEFSIAELKQRFLPTTAEATLTCAGNRRQEMNAIKPVGGVQWDAGAVGHAHWMGCALVGLLAAAGIDEPEKKHIWFEGLDPIKEKDGSVAPFAASIPIGTVTAHGCVVAYAMNGEPLTPEHGAPLRVIVPGYIGARSVKWLSKITVSDRPSPNHYVAEAYKVIQSEDKGEVAKAEPIYGFPVNAAICSPAAGAKVKAGKTLVSGYALPSGNEPATIAKVEVSRDGGKNWSDARLLGQAKPFNWQQWTAEFELSPGKHELVVCATDSRGNMMPEKGVWNLKGYLYNGWHRVTVEAV